MKKLLSILLAAAMLLSLLPAAYAKDAEKKQNAAILTSENTVFALSEQNASAGGSYKFTAVCEITGAKHYYWMISVKEDEELSEFASTNVNSYDFTISRESARNGIRLQCRMETPDGEELITGVCFVGLRPEITIAGSRLLSVAEDTLHTTGGTEYYRFSAEVIPDAEGVSCAWYVKDLGGRETLLPELTGARLTDAEIPAGSVLNGDLLFCRACYANGLTADSECFELRLSSYSDFIIKAYKTVLGMEDRTENGDYCYKLSAFTDEEADCEYVWMYRVRNTAIWKKAANASELPGELEACFNAETTDIFAGLEFRCIARDADGRETESPVVTVYAAPVVTEEPPELIFIDRDALNKTDAVTFTVSMQAQGAAPLTYAWENEAGFAAYGTVNGTDTAALTVTASAREIADAEALGDSFFCTVTDADGNTVQTEKAVLKRIGTPVITGDLPETYAYKRNEYNASTGDYNGHTFTLTAEGEYLTYEWFLSFDNGKTWKKEACEKASFKPVVSEEEFNTLASFLVKANVTAGGVAAAQSTVCRVTTVPRITKQLPDVIYVSSTDTHTIGGGEYYTISAETEAFGSGEMHYQWYYWDSASAEKDCKPFYGATSSKLTEAKLSKENVDWTSYIYCEITDDSGNTASTTHARITAVKPTLLTLPAEIAITEEDIKDGTYTCTLQAEVKAAKDTAPVLSWYVKLGENDWTDMFISTEEAAFSFTEEALLEGVQIKVCADTFGYVRSESEPCHLNVVPFFPGLPSTYTPDIGDTGTLKTEAIANGAITYQWFVYDAEGSEEHKWLPLEDNELYTGTGTNELHVFIENEDMLRKVFRCEATANGHTTASANTKLEKPDIVITQALSDVSAVLGGPAQFTAKADGMDITYRWELFDPKTGKWLLVSAVTGDTLTVKADSVNAFNYRFRCTATDGDKELSAGEAKLIRSNNVLKGDVDLDQKVTAADARLALRAAVGLEHYAVGSNAFTAADWNENGKIEAADARSILRNAVGLK